MAKDKRFSRIVLEVDPDLADFIKMAAQTEGKTIKKFLVENILIELRGCFITCPKCHKPVLDQRRVLMDKLILHCPYCDNEFEYED